MLRTADQEHGESVNVLQELTQRLLYAHMFLYVLWWLLTDILLLFAFFRFQLSFFLLEPLLFMYDRHDASELFRSQLDVLFTQQINHLQ